jgi:hypothetical protein
MIVLEKRIVKEQNSLPLNLGLIARHDLFSILDQVKEAWRDVTVLVCRIIHF